jgi:hypothetical protein
MNWISVTERLSESEEPEQVIVNSRHNGTDVVICAVFYKGEFYHLEYWQTVEHYSDLDPFERISHWMPLPEPPKE